MIRAAHGAGEVVDGKPLPRMYDLAGRGRYLRHGKPTAQIITREQRADSTKSRKAARKARRRNRR